MGRLMELEGSRVSLAAAVRAHRPRATRNAEKTRRSLLGGPRLALSGINCGDISTHPPMFSLANDCLGLPGPDGNASKVQSPPGGVLSDFRHPHPQPQQPTERWHVPAVSCLLDVLFLLPVMALTSLLCREHCCASSVNLLSSWLLCKPSNSPKGVSSVLPYVLPMCYLHT